MNKYKKLYYLLVISTILMIVALAGTIIIWTELDSFIPFAVILPVFIILFICTIIVYMRYVKFVCPKCNATFKASANTIIWSIHTPTRRRLKCPHCNTKSWCKEDFE